MTVTKFTANIAQNDTTFACSILSTWKEMQGTPCIELVSWFCDTEIIFPTERCDQMLATSNKILIIHKNQ